MKCRICNGLSCTESFHSIEEQEEYEEINGKLVRKNKEQPENYNPETDK